MACVKLDGLKGIPVLKTELYEYNFIALEAITFPHLHRDLALVTPSNPESEEWNWRQDKETKAMAQGLYTISNSL